MPVDRTSGDRLRQRLAQLPHRDSTWRWDGFLDWMRDDRRLRASTRRNYTNQLEFMARHEAAVVLEGTLEELVLSARTYLRYREDVEGAGPGALVNDHKALRTLGEYLGIPRGLWPRSPRNPQPRADVELPTPEDVHELLHASYGPQRSIEDALVRHLLGADFGLGLRAPSELYELRLDRFDPDMHVLVVNETKFGTTTRRLLIEPAWICCAPTRLSLANWLTWRDKTGTSSDRMFVRPDGTEFASKDALRAWLNRRVQPRFDWFHPYLGRHWSVNARLIEWDHDHARVANWHGHGSIDTTRGYEHDARWYERLWGSDWILRAFQTPPSTGGFGSQPSRRERRTPPGASPIPGGIATETLASSWGFPSQPTTQPPSFRHVSGRHRARGRDLRPRGARLRRRRRHGDGEGRVSPTNRAASHRDQHPRGPRSRDGRVSAVSSRVSAARRRRQRLGRRAQRDVRSVPRLTRSRS